MGLGFPHPAGRYRPGGPAFSTSGSWSCRDRERFMIRGWELILSGCGGISALSRGATLAARWLHEPQPIRNQLSGVGLLHRAGRYRPGRSLFSSAGCWSCGDMEGFLIRDKMLSSPGAAGPRRCPERQLSPRAGSMSLIQSATSQLGWGFHTLRGGVDPRDIRLRPRVVGVVEIWKDF